MTWPRHAQFSLEEEEEEGHGHSLLLSLLSPLSLPFDIAVPRKGRPISSLNSCSFYSMQYLSL